VYIIGASKANSQVVMRSQVSPIIARSRPIMVSSGALRRPPANELKKVEVWPAARRRLISYSPPARNGPTRKKPEVAMMNSCPLRHAKIVITSPAIANNRP
jgi:hypothetical protein